MGTTPGKNAFLTSVYCVLVPFIYWFFSKIRPDRYNILAACICIVGIGFISFRSDFITSGGSLVALGDVLTLISGIFYAFHIVAIARFSSGKDVILLTIIQFIVFCGLAWTMSFALENIPASLSSAEWMSLIYLGVFATAIALLLQSVGQKYTPASQAAIILSLEGVFGVVFSLLFYGEKITGILLIGFALIFISVVISETKMDVHPLAYLRSVYAKIVEKKATP
jgi:drug/metabolite transporter (DMT)-like permease